MEDFFVMLFMGEGRYTPMTTGDDGDLAKYATWEEARTAAANTSLGEHFGYEIFEIGDGQ